MKKRKFLIISLVGVLIPTCVFASDNEVVGINTEQALTECLETSGLCKMDNDIELSGLLDIDKDVVLDLNGHTLAPQSGLELESAFINVKHGATLTISDSTGTGKISTGSRRDSSVWGAIELGLEEKDSSETSELIVNSGTIEGYYYGITGHGNYDNTKITINGGTIKGLNEEDSVGIYNPQDGMVIINGGTIKGGTGVEMRAGTLVVEDGDIEGIAPKFVKKVNESGSTTNGVGIAIAQHKTKKALDVTINDGNIKGQYALYEWNPHQNSAEDIQKVKLKITGGHFTGTAAGVGTVYSEDLKNFVTGGTFNKSVEDYKSAEASSTSIIESSSDVSPSSSSGILKWLAVPAVLGLALGGAYLYNKKIR